MGFHVITSTGSIKLQAASGPLGPTGPTGPTGPSLGPQVAIVSFTGATAVGTSWANVTGASGAITPSSTGSRVRIQAALNMTALGSQRTIDARVTRGNGGTVVQTFNAVYGTQSAVIHNSVAYLDCIDSPATTTGTTYYVQAQSTGTGSVHDVNYLWLASGSESVSTISLSEVT